MTLDSIAQRYKAGAELCRKLNIERVTGRSTRPYLEIERRLAVCRKCPAFRGNDCAELELVTEFQAAGDGDPVSPGYCELLTREHLHCRRWRFDQQPDPPKVRANAVDRLHRQGVQRTAADRRAARREGRRRKKGVTG